MKEWKKGDRCWFWMRKRGPGGQSYKQYATVIETNEGQTLTRLRTDSAHTVLRLTNRLHESESR